MHEGNLQKSIRFRSVQAEDIKLVTDFLKLG
jgi:hypothetical protein